MNISKILLQNAISGEITTKLIKWQELRNEMNAIAEEYAAMTESECFLENEYYQLQMNNLEKEFYEKQKQFYELTEILRTLANPIYLN